MAELLLELFSEEIPARMQQRAAQDLKRLVSEGLKAAGLAVGDAHAFATPRRLALVIEDVPPQAPDVSEERKGPRVGAPEKALEGFLKAAGLASIDEAEIVADEKKGDYYVARIERPGRAADAITADVVAQVLAKFPWPKSMRWGAGTFQWVRPLKSMICLLDGMIVPLEAAGLLASNATRGHRFHGNETFQVLDFEDYMNKLAGHAVMLNAEERADEIRDQAEQLAHGAGLELIADEALLQENAGLTEWPVALMGSFDESFLDVPPECLTTSMKNHQKCFSLRDPSTKALANRFILVSNLTAPDGGAEIVAGNEKVIRARLSDAKFFWDQDLKRPLDEMALELAGITFHEKLGSQKARIERVKELAFEIAGAVDADPQDARRAAEIAKADLVSGMVGEFPELQGLMGRYYAEKAGAKPEIARAIELHYKPKGPTDVVPKAEDGDAVAIAVALADKIDTLVGFWAIDEKPTGSGDPYQLRRAALGVIRILVENDLRLPLLRTFDAAYGQVKAAVSERGNLFLFSKAANGEAQEEAMRSTWAEMGEDDGWSRVSVWLVDTPDAYLKDRKKEIPSEALVGTYAVSSAVNADLLAFFAERLKVYLKDKGARHDLIDAVFSLPGSEAGAGSGQDDIALIVRRVEALSEFLATDDGANLLAGVRRASSILSIEEKKDKRSYAGTYDLKILKENEELALAAAIESVKQDTVAAINVENFKGAMNALAELRGPVDAFFDKVTVNDADPALRENRLRLLSEIRAATLTVADFSKIAG
ncbi:glycyl-tRNA synthetase subunit beta [Hyphomicrobium nitrativorans NL23]|uniref:Glycine--tRNA ligase beta subunit n=1 Tax=Hyphomicrobium nitrativorans NL23 TaxID=1029756 RepID=V5SDI0_9HYPH|nr:glycine--tRNA ligase subunit beta [Hyphomicrobium nitrativorans]AHB48115.1 glycyl-tRNA synthetase subunit beta [Hyphomicrobium nitrativorans NL23]